MKWIIVNLLNLFFILVVAWAVYFYLTKPIDKVERRLEKVEEKLQTLDCRIARIEGQLIGPPHWQPKIKEEEEK